MIKRSYSSRDSRIYVKKHRLREFEAPGVIQFERYQALLRNCPKLAKIRALSRAMKVLVAGLNQVPFCCQLAVEQESQNASVVVENKHLGKNLEHILFE